MQWWLNDEKKKKERQENQEVSRINRLLQELLHKLETRIDRESYHKEAQAANRMLIQSSVWDIGYANNLENPRVALEQALFIVHIATNEAFDDTTFIVSEADRYMRQLGNVDWGLFGDYNRRRVKIR